ncbi:MAG: hypothetical protein V3S29_09950, partial [bacterium]
MKIGEILVMNDRQRLLFLIAILAVAVLFVAGVTNYFLYEAAFAQNRERLVVTVSSQARLIEAIAKHEVDDDLEEKGHADVVGLVKGFYAKFGEISKTGEFIIARREKGQ